MVTFIPGGLTSLESDSEKPSTPNFAAAYAARPVGPTRSPIEDIWMMCPDPLAEIWEYRFCHNDNAEQIRFNLCAEIRERRIFDGANVAVTGVVHEYVEAAKG